MMSFYEITVEVRKRMDFYRARMLWREEAGVRKYHLVTWKKIAS